MIPEENACRDRRAMQVINEDLGFSVYCKRKVQSLTAAQIIKRLQSCKKLLNRHGSENVYSTLFTDEEFLLQNKVFILKLMLYVSQSLVIYLKIFELLYTFRTRILSWFEL